MANRFEEYTREQIREIAPKGMVVIPVGAVDQIVEYFNELIEHP